MLVDIGGIAALRELNANGELAIGAGITQRAAERSAVVAQATPLLHEALPFIAHPQIRNRGTVCGSVAHGDPAAELPALMLALDAVMTVVGPNGSRRVPAEEFFVSYLETAIGPDEIMTEIRIPVLSSVTRVSAFEEVSRRHGDFALAGAACVVDLDGNQLVTRARLAYLGVAPTPLRITAAEQSLIGHRLSGEAIAEAAALAAAAVDPSGDVHASGAYRKHVAGVLTRRILNTAATRAAAGTAATGDRADGATGTHEGQR